MQNLTDMFTSFSDDERIRNKILVHSEGVRPPSEIMTQRHSETADIYEWRLRNYIPITTSSWERALSVLQRIFINSKYNYETHDNVAEYLHNTRFDGYRFDEYIQVKVLKVMLEDPNAWLVWVPDLVNSSQTQLSVRPIIVTSDLKRSETNNEIVFYDEIEKTEYYDNRNKIQYNGDVYWKISRNSITKIYRTNDDKRGNEQYNEEMVFEHGLGVIPYLTLGGRWNSTYNNYTSFFHSFIQIADEAIKQFSDWQYIMATSGYPIKEMANMECDAPGCHDGELEDGSTCRVCNGTGIKPFSPSSVLIRPETMNTTQFDPRPLLQYHTPPPQIIEYAQKAWQMLLEKAEASINMVHVFKPQSGIAKEIDREDMYSMLSEISSNVFNNIFYNSLYYISRFVMIYRKDMDAHKVIIYPPTDFTLKDVDGLTVDYQEYIANNADKNLVQRSYKDLIMAKYTGNLVEQRIADVQIYYDDWMPYSADEKMALKESGVLTEKDFYKSLTLSTYIRRMINDIGEVKFQNAKLKDLADMLDIMYDEYFEKLKIKEEENGVQQENETTAIQDDEVSEEESTDTESETSEEEEEITS